MMRRMFLGGLVVAALAAGGSALAVEAADSAAPAAAKHAVTSKPKQRPLPLSAGFDTTRTPELPAASVQTRQPSSTQRTWTGTYIGVGAGSEK